MGGDCKINCSSMHFCEEILMDENVWNTWHQRSIPAPRLPPCNSLWLTLDGSCQTPPLIVQKENVINRVCTGASRNLSHFSRDAVDLQTSVALVAPTPPCADKLLFWRGRNYNNHQTLPRGVFDSSAFLYLGFSRTDALLHRQGDGFRVKVSTVNSTLNLTCKT